MNKISWLIIFILRTNIIFSNEFNKNSKIYVAGHTGLVGSTIVKKLLDNGFKNIITYTSNQLDLRNQEMVERFFESEKPEYVFLAAAKVGGIKANIEKPADFIYDNLMISTNIIHAAYKHKVKKLLFLGSSCIYPKNYTEPIKESYLLSGPLEPTNEFYSIAKIAGLKLCEAYNKQHGTKFIACMPTNIYGPGDNFDINNCHVLSALINKFVNAKNNNLESVTVWGTGSAYREFLGAEDLADACLFLMQNYQDNEIINVGRGEDISIKDLAYKIKNLVGFKGEIIFDTTKPDGMKRKLLDVSKINNLGWKAQINLDEGLKKTIDWYIKNQENKK